MPELRKKSAKNKRAKESEFFFTEDEQRLLRKIGRQIQYELFKQQKPIEWLSYEAEVSRSAIREMIGGRSNMRLLSLNSIALALGYKNLTEFLSSV